MDLLNSNYFLCFSILALKYSWEFTFSEFSTTYILFVKTEIICFLLQAFDPVKNCFLVPVVVDSRSDILLLVRDAEAVAVYTVVWLYLVYIQSTQGDYVRWNLLLLTVVNVKRMVSEYIISCPHGSSFVSNFHELTFFHDNWVFRNYTADTFCCFPICRPECRHAAWSEWSLLHYGWLHHVLWCFVNLL